MDERNLLDEQYRYFEFNYPGELRFLFGVLAILFLVPAALSFRVTLIDDLELWIPLLFLALGVIGLWCFVLLSGTVILSGDYVEQRRFGIVKRIPFKEITEIRDRPFTYSLVIKSFKKKIVVEKQLRRYPYFYEMLVEMAPRYFKDTQTVLPITIKISKWVYVGMGLSSLFGFFLLGYVFETQSSRVGFIAAIAFIVFGGIVCLVLPSSYYFDADGVVITSPLSERFHRWDNFKELKVIRQPLYGSNQYIFEFSDGKFIISDMTAESSVDELISALSKHFNGMNAGGRDDVMMEL